MCVSTVIWSALKKAIFTGVLARTMNSISTAILDTPYVLSVGFLSIFCEVNICGFAVVKHCFENLYFTRITNPVAKQAEKNNNLINLTINRTESIYTA